MDALRAFEAVDFSWTQTLESVWQDSGYDVPSLHRKERDAVLAKVRSMARSADATSPLGWVLVGPAGIGKTHLLSALRREVAGIPATFVLVDMSGVRDFWETVLLGFIDSLQRLAGSSDRTQGQRAVQHIAELAAVSEDPVLLRPPKLARVMDELVRALGRTHRAQTLKHADTLRALVLLNSDHPELSTLGYAWLQGYGVDESAQEMFGFSVGELNIREKKPSAVVEGLSWLLSLGGPMVLALDQLDPMVMEHHVLAAAGDFPEDYIARQLVSRSILDGIGRGLLELRDVTRRALAVISCLEETWENLGAVVLKSATHRYEEQRALDNLTDVTMAEHIVRARLEAAYKHAGFSPPHPLWPFAPSAFASVAGLSPRELLRLCERHRRACIDEGRAIELVAFAQEEPPRSRQPSREPPEFRQLDADFDRSRAAAVDPATASSKDPEDDLGKLLLSGCQLVVDERPYDPSVHITIDGESRIRRAYPTLHARVRQVFTDQNDRERHLCLRALWKDHAIAFQARLTAAVTASGIDRQLEFRKLLLVRNAPVPSGAKTNALMTKARSAGAELIPASEDDLRVLRALVRLRDEYGTRREIFDQWLRARRPASQTTVMRPLVEWLARPPPPIAPPPGPRPKVARASAPASTPGLHTNPPAPVPPSTSAAELPIRRPSQPPPAAARESSPPSSERPMIAVGHQVIAERLAAPLTIPAEDLRQHVVVLAGAGSGKTVLVRRLIEECALLGIPSIVVDGANDLARLGDPWPDRDPSHSDEDVAKAARYHARTDVVVWTPGRSNGNPLHLGVLPDFTAVVHEPDELTQTIAMTASALASMAGKQGDDKARAILDAALRLFAQQGGGDLSGFLDLLADLPEEATLRISTARKVATALSDSLRAAMQTNPLLHEEGEPLDPGVLFGLGGTRTRVSVLSLVGLPGLDAPLQFVNQLAMTLFTWVKKNPCPADRPLRGLLVLDEAKDFVPSQSSTPCKESLIRLAAQGRKYGLGVVFATQAPKSIDHNVIANASTQFFGKASSPAAIDTVEEALRSRGATKVDVARLSRGRFYLAGNGMPAPVKIAAPLCLSHHPSSPPDEADVLRRAAACRARMG